MASPFESPMITIFGEHISQDQLTVASFVWPEANTVDTYTITANQGLSLELDKHFPVRLARIALYDQAISQSQELISQVTSPELYENMAQASRTGQFIMNLVQSRRSRLLLAKIQIMDASTPPSVRRACMSMLAANSTEGEVVA